jgi:hypothetical protein
MNNRNYLPGIRVKILDKEILVAAGYEINSDPNDFLNLIAGKEITIKEKMNDYIYTSLEYPDVAIYKVFIEKIVYAELSVSETALLYGLSSETIRKAFNSGSEKLIQLLSSNQFIKEFLYEQQ